MKKLFIILLTVLSASIFAQAQNKNEDCYQAIVKNDKERVAQLLKDGSDANFIKSTGPWMKVGMLTTAVNNGNVEIAKLLVEHKADVNWKDGFKTTALMYAAAKGNKEMVTFLLDSGADINANDGQGNTVLTAAKESKNEELFKFLQDKMNTRK